MRKTLLIIKREYITRVRKRSFIIMTIIGPLLMAAIMIIPIYVAQFSGGETKNIAIIDETGWFFNKLHDSDNIKFEHIYSDLNKAKENFFNKQWYAILYIPKTQLSLPTKAIIYSAKQPKLQIKKHIEIQLEKVVEDKKLRASGIDPQILKSIKTDFNLSSFKLQSNGEEKKTYTGFSMGIGYFAGLMIYFFIFLFGVQVFRGVLEEKTNRIVEIIVSSVKPFQFMMGKILGIALVGLTQFILWVFLTIGIVSGFTAAYSDKLPQDKTEVYTDNNQLLPKQGTLMPGEQQDEITKIFEAVYSINYGVMIITFIIYFLGGYLLYAALFAAIGGAVDNESDTQQFMLPITIPLIFSIIMGQYIINHPDSSLSFWLSIIPLTSPVIMMIRIPFGVPYLDLFISIGLLILGFLVTTWVASKIYRTGILMYGSKVNYKTLWKWIKYRH